MAKRKTLYSVHPGVAMVQKWIAELKGKTGRSLDGQEPAPASAPAKAPPTAKAKSRPKRSPSKKTTAAAASRQTPRARARANKEG